ncbi:MAG: right-handed parallel beta-helix repeat-containing protein [Armatimonadetes bacterium]|nr:right-handed parallel beta-helix repeat-containing protein [Armatimonadota bacterium]
MTRTVPLLALLSLGLAHAQPAEITAASCAVPDIQAAIDRLPEGGTVRVPAGEAEAIGTIKLTGGIRLVGAGWEQTKLFRGPGSDMTKGGVIISVNSANGKPIVISGLNLIGFLDPASSGADSGISLSNATDFRVARCRFQRFGSSGISVGGKSCGVVDHCLFVDIFKQPINNLGYGVVVGGTGEWRDDLVPGSADSVFVEDSEFTGCRHAIASNGGARYVFRHNHIHGNVVAQAVDCHGTGYGSKHGTQWIEVYENLIEKPAGGYIAMYLRGGGGVVFNNTIRNYFGGIGVTLDADPKEDWTRPYPIPDQIGNMWLWDNTLNGTPILPFIPPRSANHIQLDRDVFTRPMPDYQPYQYPHPLNHD